MTVMTRIAQHAVDSQIRALQRERRDWLTGRCLPEGRPGAPGAAGARHRRRRHGPLLRGLRRPPGWSSRGSAG